MKKLLLVIPGYCIGLGGLLLITYRTLRAVSSQSGTIIVHVNRFGEQSLDLLALVFLWVVCLVGLVSLGLLLRQQPKASGRKATVVSLRQGHCLDSSAVSDVVLRLGTSSHCVGFQENSETPWISSSHDRTSSVVSVTMTILQEESSEKNYDGGKI